MSSNLRSTASRHLPYENSSTKQVWLFYAINSSGDPYPSPAAYDDDGWPNTPNLLKFSCAEGVFEFESDLDNGETSMDTILDENNINSYPYPCKFLGGLRVVSAFGPKFQQFIKYYLGFNNNAVVAVTRAGKASRVQMDRASFLNSSEYGAKLGFGNDFYFNNTDVEFNAPATGDYYPQSGFLDRWAAATSWALREPVEFTINDGEFITKYSMVMPVGDDVVFPQTYWDISHAFYYFTFGNVGTENPTNARDLSSAPPKLPRKPSPLLVKPLNKKAVEQVATVNKKKASEYGVKVKAILEKAAADKAAAAAAATQVAAAAEPSA